MVSDKHYSLVVEGMSSEAPIGNIYLHLSSSIYIISHHGTEGCKITIWIYLHSMVLRPDLLFTFENGDNLDNSYLLNSEWPRENCLFSAINCKTANM